MLAVPGVSLRRLALSLLLPSLTGYGTVFECCVDGLVETCTCSHNTYC